MIAEARTLNEVTVNTPAVEQVQGSEREGISPPDSRLWTNLPRPLLGFVSIAAAAALTAIATGLGAALSHTLPLHSVALVYLLAVVVAAVALGVRTGLGVAAFAFLAYNFFFIPPVYTLTIADPSELFALCVFLVVAVLTGSLAGGMRDMANAANRRAAAIHAQSEFAQVLAAAYDEEAILRALTQQTSVVTGGQAVMLTRDGNELQLQSESAVDPPLSSTDLQAAQRAVRAQARVPAVAAGWPGARFEFWPIGTRGDVIGALGFALHNGRRGAGADILSSVEASVRHATIALERTRLREESHAARAETERERLRTALLSSLSHDLRTPLASILGSVSSLRQLGGSLDEATRADLLAAIEEEASRLARFVTNLLDIIRLKSAAIDLKSDWLDVGDIVQAAVERARRMAPERSILLASAPTVQSIRGDSTLFEHVIFNLLDNAIKFSKAKQDIEVAVAMFADSIRVTVTDHGCGIPANELHKVFMPFYRVHSGVGDVSGTGLGLAIGRRIIEGMGGTITIASPLEAEQGTRVTVSVPIEVVPLNRSHRVPGAKQ